MPLNPEQIDNARLSEIFFSRGTDVNPRRDGVGAESRTTAAVLPHPANATTPAKITPPRKSPSSQPLYVAVRASVTSRRSGVIPELAQASVLVSREPS